MLRASPGISTRSDDERLKVGLLTVLACVHSALKNAAVVPREANRAHKSSCPVITSSSASTSFSICSKAFGIPSTEGATSSELAPTELNVPFSQCAQRVAKSEHLFRRSFSDSRSFVLFSALASVFACSSFLSCSKRSDSFFKVV
jgi:Mn2+/Fe2+ NRAMP family transporter